MENSKSQDEFPTLPSALGNPAKNQTPDSHIPTAPTATGNIFKLQDDSAKVTFLNCLTGKRASAVLAGGSTSWKASCHTPQFTQARAKIAFSFASMLAES